jgi:hypothetical protein
MQGCDRGAIEEGATTEMIRWRDGRNGGNTMDWEAPSFVEVKMDAEVNAYQDDFADFPDVQERPTEALVATNPQ